MHASYIKKIVHKLSLLRSRSFLFVLLCALGLIAFTQLAAKKNLYVIRDGDSITVHESYASSATDALDEAGIHIGVYDYVSLPEAPLSGGMAQVVIQRSLRVTIQVDGERTSVYTVGDTVGSVLSRYGITLGGQDKVIPAMESPVTDGMNIQVVRCTSKTVDVLQNIPFETIRTASNSLPYGTEKVTQAGKTGQKKMTYVARLEDGVEVSRQLVTETVLTNPQNELISYGTGGTVTAPDGQVLTYSRMLECTATAYSTEGQSNKLTAIGTVCRVGAIAVDPKVIPLRSRVYVEAANGTWIYGVAVCEDTGGAIKGNKVDLYFNTQSECYNFGVRKCKVYVLN